MVSVVIPTKNRSGLVQEAVQSVLAQEYENYEVLVVDDDSTDSTVSDLSEVEDREHRLHVFRREGAVGNANVCRNQGLLRAKGIYVIFLDSDDLLAPNCLERRVGFMERNPDVDVAVFPGKVFFETPEDSDVMVNRATGAGDLDRLIGMDWPIQTTGPIWRREALDKIGPWDEEYPSWQDVELHFRLLTSDLTVVRQSDPDYYLRSSRDSNRTSSVQQRDPSHFKMALKLFHFMGARLLAIDQLTMTRKHLLAGCFLHLAERQISSGGRVSALETWRSARKSGLIGNRVFTAGLFYLVGLAVGPKRLWRRLFVQWKWRWRLTRGDSLF